MALFYEYDNRTKAVLIRKLTEDSPIEILHKGDKQWEHLGQSPDHKDESYCRAMYLGQGCWEALERVSDEEAAEILKEWGCAQDPYTEQVHKFALKWLEMFLDPEVRYIDLVDGPMGEECFALGFKMDCGKAFCERYPDADNNCQALRQIIDEVTDVPLLGSAIHSKWRYYNHWADSGSEILEPENREWFILALERLASLSETV